MEYQLVDFHPVNRNINQDWKDIKEVIILVAKEALGRRKKTYNKRGLRIWNEEMETLMLVKKEAYL